MARLFIQSGPPRPGLDLNRVKNRYSKHKADISTLNKDKGATKLARRMWELHEKDIKHEPIDWSIKERCKPYVAGTKTCNLCLAEKIHILEADSKTSLNSRSEMLAMCRHESKFLLKNVK